MCDNNKRVSPGDNMFVVLTCNGRSVFSIYCNEFGSFAEIVRCVYRRANDCSGLATLSVRNQSQGWSCNIPLVFPTSHTNFHGFVPPLAYSRQGHATERVAHIASAEKRVSQQPRQCELPFVWN